MSATTDRQLRSSSQRKQNTSAGSRNQQSLTRIRRQKGSPTPLHESSSEDTPDGETSGERGNSSESSSASDVEIDSEESSSDSSSEPQDSHDKPGSSRTELLVELLNEMKELKFRVQSLESKPSTETSASQLSREKKAEKKASYIVGQVKEDPSTLAECESQARKQYGKRKVRKTGPLRVDPKCSLEKTIPTVSLTKLDCSLKVMREKCQHRLRQLQAMHLAPNISRVKREELILSSWTLSDSSFHQVCEKAEAKDRRLRVEESFLSAPKERRDKPLFPKRNRSETTASSSNSSAVSSTKHHFKPKPGNNESKPGERT